jgi:hypothetical protein
MRQSNYAQALDIGHKLAEIGCHVAPLRERGSYQTADSPPPFEFTPEEIELLAAMEHERWMADRKAQGWTAGADRSAKQTPYFVPFAELPAEVQEYDRQPVRNIPALLRMVGLRAVRSSGAE